MFTHIHTHKHTHIHTRARAQELQAHDRKQTAVVGSIMWQTPKGHLVAASLPAILGMADEPDEDDEAEVCVFVCCCVCMCMCVCVCVCV